MSRIEELINRCETLADRGIAPHSKYALLIKFLEAMDVLVDVLEAIEKDLRGLDGK